MEIPRAAGPPAVDRFHRIGAGAAGLRDLRTPWPRHLQLRPSEGRQRTELACLHCFHRLVLRGLRGPRAHRSRVPSLPGRVLTTMFVHILWPVIMPPLALAIDCLSVVSLRICVYIDSRCPLVLATWRVHTRLACDIPHSCSFTSDMCERKASTGIMYARWMPTQLRVTCQ